MINYSNSNDSISTWFNPTSQTVSVKLWRGPEGDPRNKWLSFSLKPGESKMLPSEYDSAIQTVNQSGEIVGGKAPQLQKKMDLPEKTEKTEDKTVVKPTK